MKFKSTAYDILYQTFFNTGLSEKIFNQKLAKGKVIITYHNVLPESNLTPFFTNFVDVSESIFELHIQTILKKYKISPALEITDPDKKGLYVSFDDGMLNNIEIVEPVLKKYGITAMFGICSGLIDKEIEFIWRDEIYLMLKSLLNKKLVFPDDPSISGKVINELNLNNIASCVTTFLQVNNKMDCVYEYIKGILDMNGIDLNRNASFKLRYSPMTLSDIKYLQDEGHNIVSHTHTHRKLSMLSDKELKDELVFSKTYLEKVLGKCDILVYPYGSTNEVNSRVKDFAYEVGYRNAFLNTSKGFISDKLFIPRINMGNVSSKSKFFGILAGLNKLFS